LVSKGKKEKISKRDGGKKLRGVGNQETGTTGQKGEQKKKAQEIN